MISLHIMKVVDFSITLLYCQLGVALLLGQLLWHRLGVLANERPSAKPNSPVWKTPQGDRFIFNTGSKEGWRIGSKTSLATGSSYCKGKIILIVSPLQYLIIENISWLEALVN